MKKTVKKNNQINEKSKFREEGSSMDCLFSILDKRIELARKRAKQNISFEEQEEYQKHHKTEIECGIEFPLKGMREDLCSDPEYAILCHNIGVCYLEEEKLCEAQKWFTVAIESIPEDYSYNEPYIYLEKIGERKMRSPI